MRIENMTKHHVSTVPDTQTSVLDGRDVHREWTRTGAESRLPQPYFDPSPWGSRAEWKRTLGKKSAEHRAMAHSIQC
jgi:hypothetical protein